jgi:hypothetical protein
VPHDRLLTVVRERLGPTPVAELVATIVTTGRTVGIPQGGPLSPLLLNLLLDAALDRPWHRDHPDTPLIRWVDDVLILTPTPTAGDTAREELRTRLGQVGLTLKEEAKPHTANLTKGERKHWLGFDIGATAGKPDLKVTAAAWNNLAATLRECNDSDSPGKDAQHAVQGWTAHYGAALDDITTATGRIRTIAAKECATDAVDPASIHTAGTRSRQRFQVALERAVQSVEHEERNGADTPPAPDDQATDRAAAPPARTISKIHADRRIAPESWSSHPVNPPRNATAHAADRCFAPVEYALAHTRLSNAPPSRPSPTMSPTHARPPPPGRVERMRRIRRIAALGERPR